VQTDCQTGLATVCIVYTNIQPVVKPVWQPVSQPVEWTVAVRSTVCQTSNWLSNQVDNRLTTGWVYVYTIQPVVKPDVLCKRGIRQHRSTMYMRPVVTDGRSVTIVSRARTAEPIEKPFGTLSPVGPRKHVLDRGAHWRNLANRTESSVCGGDAASCQITLTTCYYWENERNQVEHVVCMYTYSATAESYTSPTYTRALSPSASAADILPSSEVLRITPMSPNPTWFNLLWTCCKPKAWYTLPVYDTRVHGPWTQASFCTFVFTGRRHGCYFWHPYPRAVYTARGHGPWTRVHGP